MPENARCSLGGNAAISETDTSWTSATSTTKSAMRRRRKLRLLCRSEDWMAVLQRATGKPAGSVFIFNFTVANFTNANELELMAAYNLKNGGDFGFLERKFQAHICAVQFVLKRGTHRTRLAQVTRIAFHFCAPEKSLVIWCVAHVSPIVVASLPFTTSTSSSSFTLPYTTTQEHAAQSVQQDQLREHPGHNAHVEALPVDKLRH